MLSPWKESQTLCQVKICMKFDYLKIEWRDSESIATYCCASPKRLSLGYGSTSNVNRSTYRYDKYSFAVFKSTLSTTDPNRCVFVCLELCVLHRLKLQKQMRTNDTDVLCWQFVDLLDNNIVWCYGMWQCAIWDINAVSLCGCAVCTHWHLCDSVCFAFAGVRITFECQPIDCLTRIQCSNKLSANAHNFGGNSMRKKYTQHTNSSDGEKLL